MLQPMYYYNNVIVGFQLFPMCTRNFYSHDYGLWWQVCGISLTDNVVDLIFHVFDTNLDGNLSSEEFLGVLQKREKDIAQPTQVGIAGLISCWWNCAKTCSFTRLIH